MSRNEHRTPPSSANDSIDAVPDPRNDACPGAAGGRAAARVGSSWLVAALLVALTLAAGLATRVGARPAPGAGGLDAGPIDLGAPPTAALSFSGRLDRGAVLQGGDGLVRLELVTRGHERAALAPLRRPTDLIVVLDRSGSMAGEPLAHATAAVRELIGQLGDEDRFALISYASGAELTLPLERASGAARARWLRRIAGASANGGTDMASGLDLAHATLAAADRSGRIPRIVLLSDGHANQGDHSLAGLTGRAARAVAGEYVLSAVGVGQGFDEQLMSRLADAGTGNFYYVPHAEALAGIFADEFASARETVASALEISIEAAPGVEVIDAAGYPLERRGRRASFRPGALFAGQERRVWITLRVDADEARDLALGRVSLAYRDPAAGGERHRVSLDELPRIACVADDEAFVASLDADTAEQALEEDALNALKQEVAADVQRGDRAAAESKISGYLDETESFLGALGRELGASSAYRGGVSLQEQVAEVFEAPAAAAPARQNELGKKLAEEGTDGRRRGAKR